MHVSALAPKTHDDQISFKELLKIVADNRRLILVVTLLGVIIGGAAALIVPKTYEARVVISPVTESAQNGMTGALGSLASQFSGLASIAGLSLSGGAKLAAESQAVLRSEALTERYIRQGSLLPILFPGKWDSEHHIWKKMAASKIPTTWSGYRYFDKHVRTIEMDQKTGLVTLTIRWSNPGQAAQWANDLVKLTNDYLRNKALAEADRNVAYLKDQAAATDVVPIKQAIYALIQSEIDKAMVARGSDEYAFKVLDPAAVPERQTSPIFALWTVLGGIGGLIVVMLFVFLKAAAQ